MTWGRRHVAAPRTILTFCPPERTSHGVVRNELGLETKVGEVLLDLPTNERSKETEALGLTGVNFDDFL